MSVHESVRLALDWLSNSSVRIASGPARGGVCQAYDIRSRTYPFVYTEITGYAVSLFALAHRWTGEPRYLDLAAASAEFLLRVQVADGGRAPGSLPHGLALPALSPRPSYYAFDVAMCVQGLLDLDRVSSRGDVRDGATRAVRWLRGMQDDRGAFRSMLDGATGELRHEGHQFFDDFGSLHAKHAIAFLRHWRATGDEASREAAVRVCDWVLTLQDASGAIRATERLAECVTHPHCYALEGLLVAYHELGDERYWQAVVRGARWLVRTQRPTGGLSIAYNRPFRLGRDLLDRIRPPTVTDATAQAVRLWVLLYQRTGDSLWRDAADRAVPFLLRRQQVEREDPNARGGFLFDERRSLMFTWATMFAAHALSMIDRLDRGRGVDGLVDELF